MLESQTRRDADAASGLIVGPTRGCPIHTWILYSIVYGEIVNRHIFFTFIIVLVKVDLLLNIKYCAYIE